MTVLSMRLLAKRLLEPWVLVLLTASILALLLLTTEAFGRSYMAGVLYTRNGQRIEVLQFLDPLKKDDLLVGQSGKEEVKVRIGQLKEINLLTADVNYIFPHSKLVTETGSVAIVYRDGKSALLSNAYFEKKALSYLAFTSNGQKVEQQIATKDLVKIQFEAAAGNSRICPIDHAVFPDDYAYCPYHGVPLTWSATN